MSKNPHRLPDACIHLINSLGGPPLPTGVGTTALKVILENQAASAASRTACRIADALAARHT